MTAALPHPAARPAVRPAARRRGRGAVATVVLGVLALALSGCGAGFSAQTYQERTVSDGNNATVGAIAIRNIAVVPDPDGVVRSGSDAPVRMTLVNNSGQPDDLVSASSPAAGSVALSGPSGTTTSGVTVPAFGSTGETAGLVLRGVTSELRSGVSVPITLRFAHNGEITVDVPVATTGRPDTNAPRSSYFHEPGQPAAG